MFYFYPRALQSCEYPAPNRRMARYESLERRCQRSIAVIHPLPHGDNDRSTVLRSAYRPATPDRTRQRQVLRGRNDRTFEFLTRVADSPFCGFGFRPRTFRPSKCVESL